MNEALESYENNKTFANWLDLILPEYCVKYETAIQDAKDSTFKITNEINDILNESIEQKYGELGITIPIKDWQQTITSDFQIAFSTGDAPISPIIVLPPASYCPDTSK